MTLAGLIPDERPKRIPDRIRIRYGSRPVPCHHLRLDASGREQRGDFGVGRDRRGQGQLARPTWPVSFMHLPRDRARSSRGGR